MSRLPQTSSGRSQPVAGPPNSKVNNFYRMCIAMVTPDGEIDNNSLELGTLLLNPESVEEDIASNWSAHNIRGQSNPVLSWMSTGARTVSFETLVTKDTSDFLKQTSNPIAGAVDNAVNAIGSIASNFFGVTIPPINDLLNFGEDGGGGLGITGYLNYYRQLLYPIYEQEKLTQSPPLCVLYIGTTLGSENTTPTSTVASTHDLWVLVEFKARHTKFLPDLTPMESVCSFRFVQYGVKSFGREHFDLTQTKDVPGKSGSIGQKIAGFF